MLSDEVPGDAGGFLAGVAAGLGAGSRVAGYRLEERIGAGGMAVVFRARDERLGRLVALKILAPAVAADAVFRQRFIRESRAAAAVDDPHIVPVFEAGEAAGVLFIAMRYVPGGDVRTMVDRDGPLPPGRAAAIISPVASALDAAHAAGLVHRDVKPANMLVDARPGRPDHVYLSDFGLSKGTVSLAGLTGAGQFLGTVDYVSPEQIEGGAVDGRADEYALACAAFELLTGGPPFPRAEAMAVMYAQLSEPPPALTSRRPDLPAAADRVFATALAKAPGDRYASCRGFADALRLAFGLPSYDGGGVVPSAGHPPTQLAGPATGAAGPRRGAATGAVAGAVSPALAAAGMPAGQAGMLTGQAGIPAAGPANGPGRSGAAAGDPGDPGDPGDAGDSGDRGGSDRGDGGGHGGGGAQPVRRRRRIVPAALAAIAILAVAGVAATAILTRTSSHGSASFPVATCSKETEAENGIGPRGHDGCGSKDVRAPATHPKHAVSPTTTTTDTVWPTPATKHSVVSPAIKHTHSRTATHVISPKPKKAHKVSPTPKKTHAVSTTTTPPKPTPTKTVPPTPTPTKTVPATPPKTVPPTPKKTHTVSPKPA